jgi:predicted kinase
LFFGDKPSISPDKDPMLWLNTGTIASGKSTLAKKKISEWFPEGFNFGIVDKDQLKAVFPFREQIIKYYPSILFRITDEILPLREQILKKAMENRKCISAEQSLKSCCENICKQAIEHGYKIVATNISIPRLVAYTRELSRLMCDTLLDDINGTQLARSEPKENIDATFNSAPETLSGIAKYADMMLFYDLDHMNFHTLTKGETIPPNVFAQGGRVTNTALEEINEITQFIGEMLEIGAPLIKNAEYISLYNHVLQNVLHLSANQKQLHRVTGRLALAKRTSDAQYFYQKTGDIKQQWLAK